MSTEGLKGIEALHKAINETADDVRATAARTAHEAEEVAAKRRHIAEKAAADAEAAAIAARRLEQEYLDAQNAQDGKLTEIDHRAGQQAYILTGNRPDEPAQQPLVAPPARDGGTQHLPPVPPHNDPSHFVPGFPPPQPLAPHTVNIFNVRRWSGVQWLIAGIGLVVAFLVWLFTWHPILNAGDIHGDGRAWTAIVWLLILLFTGFFGGGWIGSVIEERRNRRNDSNIQVAA